MERTRSQRIEQHKARFAAMVPDEIPRLFRRLHEAPFYRAFHKQWLDTLPPVTGHALDVGCGPGCLTTELALRGLNVTGVDRSERMLDAARARGQARSSTANFEPADATELPYRSHSFDLVVASSLLNILEHPVSAMLEFGRVVRAGGLLSVLVPDVSMTEAAALTYCGDRDMPIEDTALLALWATTAPKVAAGSATQWFADAGLESAEQHSLLEGMIHVTTARRRPDEGSGGDERRR